MAVSYKDLPTRKPNRLASFDYSVMATYFITICTKQRKRLLWNSPVGAITDRPQVQLSPYGEIVDEGIHAISVHYPMILVERYAILPDHVHLLLRIVDRDGRSVIAPTISSVIRLFKGSVTKQCGESIWQKGFYDHVVRNQEDLAEISEYIANNPIKWMEKHFTER